MVGASLGIGRSILMTDLCRLLEFAPSYFDLASFKDGETKRTLQGVINKQAGKSRRNGESGPVKKKSRK